MWKSFFLLGMCSVWIGLKATGKSSYNCLMFFFFFLHLQNILSVETFLQCWMMTVIQIQTYCEFQSDYSSSFWFFHSSVRYMHPTVLLKNILMFTCTGSVSEIKSQHSTCDKFTLISFFPPLFTFLLHQELGLPQGESVQWGKHLEN